MAKPLVSDEPRELIEPLLPLERPKPKGGRLPTPDRKSLMGIVFFFKTGIQWEELLQELGCGWLSISFCRCKRQSNRMHSHRGLKLRFAERRQRR